MYIPARVLIHSFFLLYCIVTQCSVQLRFSCNSTVVIVSLSLRHSEALRFGNKERETRSYTAEFSSVLIKMNRSVSSMTIVNEFEETSSEHRSKMNVDDSEGDEDVFEGDVEEDSNGDSEDNSEGDSEDDTEDDSEGDTEMTPRVTPTMTPKMMERVQIVMKMIQKAMKMIIGQRWSLR